MLDLKITNGTIVDGTGSPGYRGDVGIRAGRIVGIGRLDTEAAREIDAGGLVVAPGFIDTHTHYDAQLHWDRLLSPSPWYGITTVVMGNCGFALAPCRAEDRRFLLQTLQHVEGIEFRSSWPALHDGDWGYETFPEFLDFLDLNNCSVNLVTQIGHTALRTWVMGPEAATSRIATDEEIAEMRRLLTEALDAGACGLSTTGTPGHTGIGGVPVPSRWADEREFLELCRGIMDARHGRVQGTLGAALTNRYVLELMEQTGVPFAEITPTRDPKTLAGLLDLGYQIYPQVQVIPGSLYTGLHDPSYFAIQMPSGGGFNARPLTELFGPIVAMESTADKLARYKEDGFLDEFIAATDVESWNRAYWAAIEIARSPAHPEWEGRSAADVASDTGRKPAEVIYELCVETDLAGRFKICFPPYGEFPSLDQLANRDDVGLGLHDAGAHLSQISSAAWPGRLLGPFVREGGLPLERAVQHATSLAAAQFGILDRGLLLSGRPADVVVFDPATIGDGPPVEVSDLPEGATRLISYPQGIEHVIVNGTPIRSGSEDTVDPSGPLPGRLLRDFQPNPRRRPQPIPDWIRASVDAEWDARVARVMDISGGNPSPDPAQPGRILV